MPGGVSALAPVRSVQATCTAVLATAATGDVYRVSAHGRLLGRWRAESGLDQAAWLEGAATPQAACLGGAAGVVYAFLSVR